MGDTAGLEKTDATGKQSRQAAARAAIQERPEGITAMAVKSQVDVLGAEVEKFKDLDAAIEWARS